MKNGLKIAAAAGLLGLLLGMPVASSGVGDGGGCEWRHFHHQGTPTVHETDVVAEHVVPRGRTWLVTNVMLLSERHSNGTADAGEFTVMANVVDPAGNRVNIAQSSLDAGSGMALQGQGMVRVGLESGSTLQFSVWLRIGKEPTNYFYGHAVSLRDCPA